MKAVLALLRKDYRVFLNDRAAVALTFVVPIALIYLFGTAFGGSQSASNIPIGVVDQSDSRFARSVIAELDESEAFRVVRSIESPGDSAQRLALTEERAREAVASGTLRYALVFPEELARAGPFDLRLTYLYNPRNDIESSMVDGLLQRTIMMQAPRLLTESFSEDMRGVLEPAEWLSFQDEIADAVVDHFPGATRDEVRATMEQLFSAEPDADGLATDAEPAADGIADLMSELVAIDREQLAGVQVTNPSVTRNVGGWAIMFLLFSLSAAANSLFDEKKADLFLRLLSAPATPTDILWSKYLFGMSMGLVQLLAMFVAGWVLFQIDIWSNLGPLVAISFATSAAATAFGMLLAAFSRSIAQSSALATLLILSMSAIGGAWFPVSLMPEAIQTASHVTLVYWAMEGFVKVVWQGAGVLEIGREIGVLLLIAIVVNAVSIWRFRTGGMFR